MWKKSKGHPKEGTQLLKRLLDRLEAIESAIKEGKSTGSYSPYSNIISKLEDIKSAVEEGASDIASELKEVQSAIDLK
jgi:hypothetical protein